MKAIYASKMYKSSKHKDRIKAALSNPVNAELVQQLREYLDDEYLTTEYFENSEENSKDVKSDDNDNEKAASESNSSNNVHPPVSRSFFNENANVSDDVEDESASTDDIVEDTDNNADDTTEDDGVEEATNLDNKSAVFSQTVLYTNPDYIVDKMPEVVEEIKGTLNSRQDTCGVDRVFSKEDELWIYYNDKVNLNNVMSPVIELLNSANYTFLDFNRLARSENAMVFQVTLSDSNSDVKSTKEDADVKDK